MQTRKKHMVPVLDINNNPLMPCSHKRARLLMGRGRAKAFYQKGFFCIKMKRDLSYEPKFQPIGLGIDPGSKREGYTISTPKCVVMNITTDTPSWVKDKMETRRSLRRSRRYRKTPYRACRSNRSALRNEGRVPPSTKARWQAKLRITKVMTKLFPITHCNVEDIAAASKEGKKRWNKSFSPLQVGKKYFANTFAKDFPSIKLTFIKGYGNHLHRIAAGYPKDKKNKLSYFWDTHNSDSHCLAEMTLGISVKPIKHVVILNFIQSQRRNLHRANAAKGNIRSKYGGTHAINNFAKGSLAKYKDGDFYYLSGCSKENAVSIISLASGKRKNQFAKLQDLEIYNYIMKFGLTK